MPRVISSSFVIAVHDLDKSTRFYRDVLGFDVEPDGDEGWRVFASDGCRIMAGRCPESMPASKLGDHSYFAYLEVADIDTYYETVRAAGAQMCQVISDTPWGMREFGVVTVDGHRIMFGATIKEGDPHLS